MMRHWVFEDWLMAGVGSVVVLLMAAAFYGVWYETNFDYSVCEATDVYEDRHQAAWVQIIPKQGDMPQQIIHHPARDWTERLYMCPGDYGELSYEKWRNEDRAQNSIRESLD